MTQDQAPSHHARALALCDACAGIQRNWRRALGHPELMQGSTRSDAHKRVVQSLPNLHAGSVTITRYRCERCGTLRDYENNKVKRNAGWSVVGSPNAK